MGQGQLFSHTDLNGTLYSPECKSLIHSFCSLLVAYMYMMITDNADNLHETKLYKDTDNKIYLL